jgi:aryl-alcohol dehydrogenase-like predicted oxidoreductase
MQTTFSLKLFSVWVDVPDGMMVEAETRIPCYTKLAAGPYSFSSRIALSRALLSMVCDFERHMRSSKSIMKYRRLGKTNFEVSEVSLGTWQIGASWGAVTEADAVKLLHTAIDQGINFFDTADVYGDGRSERLIAEVLGERTETIYVATKAGRRLQPHTAEGYNESNLTAFVERSLTNLKRETLDLVQLHCPPTDVYFQPETFAALDNLKKAGKILHYGVSVARVEEALKATEFPGVASVQIIFNLFRQRPKEHFFPLARLRDVGILIRLPLASGLLGGKITKETQFSSDDHRNFNRQGEQFDRGETFSGVDLDVALDAVEKVRHLVPPDTTMAGFAMRWILEHPEVSCVIPGARSETQVLENVKASSLPKLGASQMDSLAKIYEEQIRALVHQRW